MDSPVDPELRPAFGQTPAPIPPPPLHRDDALLQGRDIELARPTRSVLAPEFIPHSTLEVAPPPDVAQPQSAPPPPHPSVPELPAHPALPASKAWDAQDGKPGFLYSHSALGGPLPELAATREDSESVFSSPFGQPSSSSPPGKRKRLRGAAAAAAAAAAGRIGGGGGAAGGGGGGKGRVKREVICGMTRRRFKVVLALGILVLVIAIAGGVGIGVGVGVGLSSKNSKETDDATASPSSPTTPSTTSSITTNPTISTATPTTGTTKTPPLLLPDPTATADPSSAVLSCPADNLTLYTPSEGGSLRRFLLLCDRDYTSQQGSTTDMYQTPTNSLVDCIGLCAVQDGCVGAGWGESSDNDNNNDGDQGKRPTCWLKSSLGEFSRRSGWSFAVLYEEGGEEQD
ncbi:hypothetical protein VTG60DRAFT_1163 [Thermothelomyces hinnuleus]